MKMSLEKRRKEEGDEEEPSEQQPVVRRINKIIIDGNKNVTTQAIMNRLPYKTGEVF